MIKSYDSKVAEIVGIENAVVFYDYLKIAYYKLCSVGFENFTLDDIAINANESIDEHAEQNYKNLEQKGFFVSFKNKGEIYYLINNKSRILNFFKEFMHHENFEKFTNRFKNLMESGNE